ncbi:M6 family metalloprotease domain-containing protein [Pleionea sediminis]|uniref:M6 family metalloprotease domain-containing protein n=1 Tax=Pleionea sediminis TaxID=2569479 RepID=UPI0011859863|nr:M6 family metalloprotease domain-containing protein [Pleionea sediminis]
MEQRTLSTFKKTMKNKNIALSMVLGTSLISQNLSASIANPDPFTVKQCGETSQSIQLVLKGSAEQHWEEDLNGYTVIRNGNCYEYAKSGTDGKLLPTGKRVGIDTPTAIEKGIKPPKTALAFAHKDPIVPLSKMPTVKEKSANGSTNVATRKNLVILIRFADHTEEAAEANGYPERVLPSASDFDVLFNQEGGDADLAPAGSVKDVYLTNSYGQLNLESTVVDWYTSSETEAYWADGDSGMTTRLHTLLKAALDNADQTINFSDFDQDNDGYIDAITFVHSGYGAEWGGQDCYTSNDRNSRIWSHKWGFGAWTSDEGVRVSSYNINPALWARCGSDIGRVGVIAHELGHFFGLPDLYDTNGGGQGIGSYGLMANSWGSDGSQRPPFFSAWGRQQLGFNEPVEITVPGKYLLDDNTIYKVQEGYPNREYLLIEKRQRKALDGTPVFDNIPNQADGVAIWHIDDAAGNNSEGHPDQAEWPENGNHYKVALLQADGNYDMEKGNNQGDRFDLYSPNTTDMIGPDTLPNTDSYQGGVIQKTFHTISNISDPADEMTFCFNQTNCQGFLFTVENGQGGGQYAAGKTVTITANTAPEGYEFDRWVIREGSVELASSTSLETTAKIQPGTTTIEATYKVITYALNISNGSGDGEYAAGEVVSITANSPEPEYEFDRWIVTNGSADIAQPTSPETTVTIGTQDVSIEATYKVIKYQLNIEMGSGDGEYAAGESISITADAPADEFEFDRWVVTSGNAVIDSPTSMQTSVTMGSGDSTVEATYKAILYTVTINGGSGSGNYAAGETVNIIANEPAEEMLFDRWVVVEGSAEFANPRRADTTMTVGSGGAVIEATYKSESEEEESGSLNFALIFGLILLGLRRIRGSH